MWRYYWSLGKIAKRMLVKHDGDATPDYDISKGLQGLDLI